MAPSIRAKRGVVGSIPTLAAGELGYATDTKELFVGNNSGGNTKIGPTSSGALTEHHASLGSDVTLPNGSWTDVLTLSLAAGTFIISASAQLLNATGSVATGGARITDPGGTNVAQGYSSLGAGFANTCALTCILTMGGSGTVTLQGRANSTGITMTAAAFDTDFTATQFIAVQIA